MSDELLYEVATALRDLSSAVVRWEQAVMLEYENCEDRRSQMIDLAENAEQVLARVVEREGDIRPTQTS